MIYFVIFIIILIVVGLLLFYYFKSCEEKFKIKPVNLLEPEWPRPEIIPKPKDISKPVISFVKMVKSNPKRFKKQRGYDDSTGFPVYYIMDKVTKKEFNYSSTFRGIRASGNSIWSYSGNPSFLTQDEWEYVDKEIGRDHHSKAVARLHSMKVAKQKRLQKVERQHLTEIYKQE